MLANRIKTKNDLPFLFSSSFTQMKIRFVFVYNFQFTVRIIILDSHVRNSLLLAETGMSIVGTRIYGSVSGIFSALSTDLCFT